MRQRTVRNLLRIKDSYYPAVVAANGTIKPFYADIGGKPVCLESGVNYLRYTDAKGKRHCQYVGRDPKLARTMQLQRLHVIAGEEMGLETVDPPPAPKPQRITRIEPLSVVPLVHPLVPPPDLSGRRLPLAASVRQVRP